jgi:collagen type III alpha
MATGPLPSVPPVVGPGNGILPASTSGTGPLERAEEFVRTQVERTRWRVKILELSTALLNLLGTAIVYLLILVLVDHWLVGLSSPVRWVAFIGLVGGLLIYAYKVIWPLLCHAIHPLYAARSIEQGAPQLKNSLINFLLLRTQTGKLPEAVYGTLAVQAAHDLSAIPLDQSVDRSRLIKIGYVLAGLLTLTLIYAMLSPKAPLPSAVRVIAPWEDVARPTRVHILQVTPGDSEVYQGESVAIAAEVAGSVDREQGVRVVFSSLDGRTVNQSVPLVAAAGESWFRAPVPPGTAGIEEDLVYHVEAGDARSAEYQLRVSPAPTIWVEQLEYALPKYTGLEPETVERQGDIRALEGTRVTIRARANHPIKTAFLELEPAVAAGVAATEFPPTEGVPSTAGKMDADASSSGTVDGVPPQSPTTSPVSPLPRDPSSTAPLGTQRGELPLRQRQPMQVNGLDATATLILELQADRRTPRFHAYRLGIVTERGDANRTPVTYSIEVVPDLPPEVAILTPESERVSVRQDGQQRIEVRAVDPDFGLKHLQLVGSVEGRVVFERQLIDDPTGRTGQQLASFQFIPSELGLRAGTKVTYRAIARDNRTSPGLERPEPNVRTTKDRFIEVVAPPPAKIPDSGSDSAEGQKNDQTGSSGDSGETGSSGGGKDGMAAESGENGSGEGQAEKGSRSAGTGNSSGKSESGSSGQQAGASGQSEPDSGAAEGSAGTPQPDSATPGKEPSGTPSDSSQPQAGGQPGSATSSQADSQGTAEPLHDGEVFEKALERLRQQGAKATDNPNRSDSNEASPQARDADSTQPNTPPSDSGGLNQPETKPQPGTRPNSNSAAPSSSATPPPTSSPQARTNDGGKNANAAQNDPSPATQPGVSPASTENNAEQDPSQPKPASSDNPSPAQPQPSPREQTGQPSSAPKAAPQPNVADQATPSDSANPAEANSPDSETMKPGESTRPQDSAAASPKPSDPAPDTNRPRPSDSQGAENGDQSGGGKPGPGQSANQPGKGMPGSNSPADQGAGAAGEPGTGETAGQVGDQQPASAPTGRSGGESGDGSRAGDRGQGSQAGPAAPSPSQPAKSTAPPGASGDGSSHDGRSGPPLGGGVPSDTVDKAPSDRDWKVADGDTANLEYAQQATDLVIDYLKDQRDQPDPELLRDLGWSVDELRSFIDRWETLKKSAREGTPAEQKNLADSLRSLGLRSPADSARRERTSSDRLRGLQESGIDSAPPAAYRDAFRAFKKGTARASEPSGASPGEVNR